MGLLLVHFKVCKYSYSNCVVLGGRLLADKKQALIFDFFFYIRNFAAEELKR